jgi:DNA-binding NarL/FixJ family response regulator
MQHKIQLVIVDDHEIFRNGVISILQLEPGIEVVGEGVTAEDAIRLADELLPDVMLLDINIPGNGLTAARVIAQQNPAVKVVMLTASTEEDYILEAFKSGAQGYLFKGAVTSEIVNILNDVNTGVRYLPAPLAELLIDPRDSTEITPQIRHNIEAKLNQRERAILALIAKNKSLGEIGRGFDLSERFIKKIVTNIAAKLDLHTIE